MFSSSNGLCSSARRASSVDRVNSVAGTSVRTVTTAVSGPTGWSLASSWALITLAVAVTAADTLPLPLIAAARPRATLAWVAAAVAPMSDAATV